MLTPESPRRPTPHYEVAHNPTLSKLLVEMRERGDIIHDYRIEPLDPGLEVLQDHHAIKIPAASLEKFKQALQSEPNIRCEIDPDGSHLNVVQDSSSVKMVKRGAKIGGSNWPTEYALTSLCCLRIDGRGNIQVLTKDTKPDNQLEVVGDLVLRISKVFVDDVPGEFRFQMGSGVFSHSGRGSTLAEFRLSLWDSTKSRSLILDP